MFITFVCVLFHQVLAGGNKSPGMSRIPGPSQIPAPGSSQLRRPSAGSSTSPKQRQGKASGKTGRSPPSQRNSDKTQGAAASSKGQQPSLKQAAPQVSICTCKSR